MTEARFDDQPRPTPSEALLADRESMEALIALSNVRTRHLVLPPRIREAYLAHTWRTRTVTNVAWMLWAAALNAFCCLFTPFIAPPEALAAVLTGRIMISAALAIGAWAIHAAPKPGRDGPVTIAVCVIAIAIVGEMGAQAGPQFVERYIVQVIFMCGTAIVISRIDWRHTVTLTAAVIAALTILLAIPTTTNLSLAEKMQIGAFFDVGLVGLALAKQAMIRLKYRVFVLGLLDRIKVGEIERMNLMLHAMARTDPLTAIPNRRGFDEAFAALRAQPGVGAALMMIDIDFFKRLNDAKGHAVGDECLGIVAGVIGSELRKGLDFLARFGGEEFVAVLPDVTEREALSVAERIRTAVESRAIENPRAPCRVVTVSVGIAAMPPIALDRLLELADAALYQAKSSGRNAVRIAHPPRALNIA